MKTCKVVSSLIEVMMIETDTMVEIKIIKLDEMIEMTEGMIVTIKMITEVTEAGEMKIGVPLMMTVFNNILVEEEIGTIDTIVIRVIADIIMTTVITGRLDFRMITHVDLEMRITITKDETNTNPDTMMDIVVEMITLTAKILEQYPEMKVQDQVIMSQLQDHRQGIPKKSKVVHTTEAETKEIERKVDLSNIINMKHTLSLMT